MVLFSVSQIFGGVVVPLPKALTTLLKSIERVKTPFSSIHLLAIMQHFTAVLIQDLTEKIKWRGDLKESTALILSKVSSLKN